MAVPAKRRNVLERPGWPARVIALVLEGKSDAEVAKALSTARTEVKRQAVSAFRKRHKAELTQVIEEAERETKNYAIARLVDQIAGLDEDWLALGEVQKARAADKRYASEPGYSTGRMVHSQKTLGGGEFAEIVDEYKVDTAVIAERRNLVMAAAELMGQLQGKKGDQGGAIVLIREYHQHGGAGVIGLG